MYAGGYLNTGCFLAIELSASRAPVIVTNLLKCIKKKKNTHRNAKSTR